MKSDPVSGRTIKEGTTVTLFKSTGAANYEMEDFVGKNNIEVKTILEKINNLFVVVVTEEVEDITEYDEGEIIKQEPEAGTKLAPGDKVTLYIPDMSATYPDFTKGDYSLADIEAFAEKYKLNLSVEYEETHLYEVGTIIKQNPAVGVTIVSGMTLKIVIADEPEIEEYID